MLSAAKGSRTDRRDRKQFAKYLSHANNFLEFFFITFSVGKNALNRRRLKLANQYARHGHYIRFQCCNKTP